ncbi:MAG: tetratricopeptide repeat protein, partial [Chloroflexota bacterium]
MNGIDVNSSSSILEHRSRRFPRAYGVLIASFVVVGVTVVASLVRPIGPTATETQDRNPAASTLLAPLTGPGAAIPAVGSIAQIDHSIRAWTTNLAANPKDFISATNLATLYHARGRLTGNLDDQARALEAARTAAAIAPNQTAASSLEATILYTLHDFGASLAVADRLYRANPADLGALATRADTELELGQMAAARADYDTLAARASGPAIDIRLARLAYLSGDAARSLTLAIAARDAATADPGTDLGFYHYAVGEYARLTGDGEMARRSYTAAIALRPADFGSLLGLGKVQASTGDLAGAIATLEQAAAIVPQPETLTLLGDLHALMGDATGAADAYATVGAIRTLSSIEGLVFDRQLLLFDLDHGAATSASL